MHFDPREFEPAPGEAEAWEDRKFQTRNQELLVRRFSNFKKDVTQLHSLHGTSRCRAPSFSKAALELLPQAG